MGSRQLDRLITAYSYDPTVVPQLIEEIFHTRGHGGSGAQKQAMYSQVGRQAREICDARV